MTEDDLSVLALQPTETLAEWWCQLNGWKWPDDLPNQEPTEYERDGRRLQIMRWIENSIGKRKCSRAWNHSMTDEEFNDFWRGHFEGVEHARVRYQQRVMKRIKFEQMEKRP
jgi:phage terminase large subunit-like protein